MGIEHKRPWILILVVVFILVTMGARLETRAASEPKITPTPLAIQRSSLDIRAIWVQGDAAVTPADADRMLERVKRGGFNTILYLVNAVQVNYRSQLLPLSNAVTPEYDPLAYVIKKAHAQGIRVEAWWTPGRVMEDDAFRKAHPTWDIGAIPGIPNEIHWLNFAQPDARDFVGSVVVEIARNYDVDGIHLDYIRFPPPSDVPAMSDFVDDQAVPLTIQSVYQRLKAARPNVELSAAVLPRQSTSASHLQNWAKWLDGGYIDHVMPMAYYATDEQDQLEQAIREWLPLPHRERLVVGLSVHISNDHGNTPPKTPDELAAQIELVREAGVGGYSIFDEEHITPELLDRLAQIPK